MKMAKSSRKKQKTLGKRRNSLLRAIFPFPAVLKRFDLQTSKDKGLFLIRLTDLGVNKDLKTL